MCRGSSRLRGLAAAGADLRAGPGAASIHRDRTGPAAGPRRNCDRLSLGAGAGLCASPDSSLQADPHVPHIPPSANPPTQTMHIGGSRLSVLRHDATTQAPPRDVRRLLSLEGRSLWQVPRRTRPSCGSACSPHQCRSPTPHPGTRGIPRTVTHPESSDGHAVDLKMEGRTANSSHRADHASRRRNRRTRNRAVRCQAARASNLRAGAPGRATPRREVFAVVDDEVYCSSPIRDSARLMVVSTSSRLPYRRILGSPPLRESSIRVHPRASACAWRRSLLCAARSLRRSATRSGGAAISWPWALRRARCLVGKGMVLVGHLPAPLDAA